MTNTHNTPEFFAAWALYQDVMPFIQRFLRNCQMNWSKLSTEQLASIRKHVESQDFPINLGHWKAIADQAGFRKTTLIYRDPAMHYGLFELI